MRIGQITTSYKPIRGGAEVYLDELNVIFKKAGHSVHVYQPNTGINSLEIIPVKMRFMKLPNMLRYNLSLIPYFKKIKQDDILIIHYPEHFWPFIWHPKTIVLTHGVNWEFNSKLRQLSRFLMAKLAYRFAWRFVANDTNFLREMGVDISPKEKMFERVGPSQYFIPNCIDINEFRPAPIPDDLKGEKFIIVPRNFTYPRGVDMAIMAMRQISLFDKEAKLLLVGDALPTDDSQKFKKRLIQLVDDLGLNEKVRFYGNHPHDKMPGIYSAGQITLIPTRGSEGTSLSALESMSVGTPVITTFVAGLKDLPSFQCDPNPDSIARAVIEVLKNRAKFSQSQSDQVKKIYNLDNWSKAWLEVIKT